MSIVIDDIEYAGVIYKIENKITHQVYIGQTTNCKGFDGRYSFSGEGIERVYAYLKGNKKRNERHNQHLRRSIEKYGFDAFIVDRVFDVAITKEELNTKEEYYIRKFDCFKNGYNQTFGGDNFPRGKYCKNSKRVCQIGTDGSLIRIWDSATDAACKLNVCPSSISNVCNGKVLRKSGDKSKTAGGYVWVFEEDYDPSIDYALKRPKQNMGHGAKPVLLLDANGDIAQEYYSINEASKQTGLAVESIRKICLHKIKNPTCKFIYKSEYIEEQRLSVKGYAEQSA